jgi:hypothetical protein
MPALVLCGGLPPKASKVEDPDAQMDFMVRVECQLCGYTMFFNAEKFRDGDTPVLVKGWTDEQEEEAERAGPL